MLVSERFFVPLPARRNSSTLARNEPAPVRRQPPVAARREAFSRRQRGPRYFDPPFNSNTDYNVLFREASEASQAQFHAFTDRGEFFRKECSASTISNTAVFGQERKLGVGLRGVRPVPSDGLPRHDDPAAGGTASRPQTRRH